MLRKIQFYFFVIFMTTFLVGCPKKQEIEPIEFKSFKLFLLDNRFEKPDVTQTSELPAKAFGLRLLLDYELTSESQWDEETAFTQSNTIDSLSITSTADFDSLLTAGTNLVQCFSVFKNYEFYDFQNYLTGHRVVDVYKREGVQAKEAIDLLLMELPKNIADHEFSIRMVTQDGQVLEQTSAPIQLNL